MPKPNLSKILSANVIQSPQDDERFGLDWTKVKLGETVIQLDTKDVFVVINLDELDNDAGYLNLTASALGITAAVGTPGEIDIVMNGTIATVSLPDALVFTGKTVADGTFNNPAINTPVVTGGIFNGGNFNNPIIGTPTVTGGTFTGGTFNTPSLVGAVGSLDNPVVTDGTFTNGTFTDGTFTNGTFNSGTFNTPSLVGAVGTLDNPTVTNGTFNSPAINTPTVTGGAFSGGTFSGGTFNGPTINNAVMVAPALGTPVSGIATNLTGTALGLTAGNALSANTVVTNANLTGDVTSVGNATTLATVNGAPGTFGTATLIPVITVNAKGLVTLITTVAIPASQPPGNYLTALTGDVAATGPGSAAATLATVNANVGSFGSASLIPVLTVNAKGLITAVSTVAPAVVAAAAGTLTGTTLAANVVNASLNSITPASGTLNLLGAVSTGNSGSTNGPLTVNGLSTFSNGSAANNRAAAWVVFAGVGMEMASGGEAFPNFGTYTNHPWFLTHNSVRIAQIAGTGIAITGAISATTTINAANYGATGNFTFSGANSTISFNGATYGAISSVAALYLNGVGVYLGPANQLTVYSAGIIVVGSGNFSGDVQTTGVGIGMTPIGGIISILRTDNTGGAQANHVLMRRGTGVTNEAVIQTLSDGNNGVSAMRLAVGVSFWTFTVNVGADLPGVTTTQSLYITAPGASADAGGTLGVTLPNVGTNQSYFGMVRNGVVKVGMGIDTTGKWWWGSATGPGNAAVQNGAPWFVASALGIYIGTPNPIVINVDTQDGITLSPAGAAVISVNSAGPLALRRRSSDGNLAVFYRDTAGVGSIGITTAGVIYNTTSDARLKTNVRDYTGKDSGRIIDGLRPRWYDWKSGSKGHVGFLAQEENEVDPLLARIGAVTVGGDDPNNIDTQWQRSDQALVPILVAEIKSLRNRLALLEA